MNTFFTRFAEQQLEKKLYTNPVSYAFTPYADMPDFFSTFASAFFLPICNLALTLSLLIETVVLAISVSYYYFTNKEDKHKKLIEECTKSAVADFKMLAATIFVTLCMLIIFLFRLISTCNHIIDSKKGVSKSQAASNYAKLCIEVRQDLKSIMENIDRFNVELCGYVEKNKTTNKEHEGLQIKLERHSVSKESNINVERTKEGIETEVILNELQHLRIGYPEYNLGASPTTQEIQDAYKELEEHHQKTVNLALTLFPRLDGILNYTRNEREKIKMEF